MIRQGVPINEIVAELNERAKELKCLYKVLEIMNENLPEDEFLMEIVKHIWGGWQYPNITRVIITFEGKIYKESGWSKTNWVQSADIVIDDNISGKIEVFYTEFKRMVSDSQFLPEEQNLLNTIAKNIGTYIFNQRLIKTLELLDKAKNEELLPAKSSLSLLPSHQDVHWTWRSKFATIIADKLDFEKYGVKAFYLIGSTKNASAGPSSDIDILLHFAGDNLQETALKEWMEGWSLCLSEMNYLNTGYKTDGLIDLHIITDLDIKNKNSFAVMIGAITNGAKLIRKRD